MTSTILHEVDAANPKAMYRQLVAYENLKEYQRLKEVYCEFKAEFPDVESTHPEFVTLIRKNDINLARERESERRMYLKMFG